MPVHAMPAPGHFLIFMDSGMLDGRYAWIGTPGCFLQTGQQSFVPAASFWDG